MPVEWRETPARENHARADASHGAVAALLRWYGQHARRLPWRAPPGSNARPAPYHVWLSEVMLQQTTVTAVLPYFTRFVTRWPTLDALAAADPADILAAWAGLGYYSRARNLIACAAVVAQTHGGLFPAEEAALRALPGIGAYTAAAIAAFAFGADTIPLDANLDRVIARFFGIDTPLPAGRQAIAAAAQSLWPSDGSGGDLAQAMMDLGASLCSARSPQCTLCPVNTGCAAFAAGRQHDLPVKKPKGIKPHRHGRADWIERDGMVWLVRRAERGMLGGMRALPGGDWGEAAQQMAPGRSSMGTVRHVFTHFSLDLAVDRVDQSAQTVGEGEWWPIERLDEAGLPTLYRHAAKIARGQ